MIWIVSWRGRHLPAVRAPTRASAVDVWVKRWGYRDQADLEEHHPGQLALITVAPGSSLASQIRTDRWRKSASRRHRPRV